MWREWGETGVNESIVGTHAPPPSSWVSCQCASCRTRDSCSPEQPVMCKCHPSKIKGHICMYQAIFGNNYPWYVFLMHKAIKYKDSRELGLAATLLDAPAPLPSCLPMPITCEGLWINIFNHRFRPSAPWTVPVSPADALLCGGRAKLHVMCKCVGLQHENILKEGRNHLGGGGTRLAS